MQGADGVNTTDPLRSTCSLPQGFDAVATCEESPGTQQQILALPVEIYLCLPLRRPSKDHSPTAFRNRPHRLADGVPARIAGVRGTIRKYTLVSDHARWAAAVDHPTTIKAYAE